ncbi:VIT and vWA domain-containing protein [Sphaerotilus uruguayifluvii]|uniref:Ca-activated chloride channel family protein n=1 Tax=Sphaerotilus uruguayifluvii TaxID=2735897 RepID=A0ABX2G2N3_9BURK|nr:VIT and VWA domain-containing protein [Leptothrix sp. C29]NRT55703.1 Ca-activated chloride channel family protein [Leptothrix sp. C29]
MTQPTASNPFQNSPGLPAERHRRSPSLPLLRGARVSGKLRGLLFESTLELVFRNDTDESLEVIHTFALPAGAVLLDIEVQLDGQRLTGRIVPAAQADIGYEQALCEGRSAVMLESNRNGSFSLNLGHLRPGAECVLRLGQACELQPQAGHLRLIVPTVIAPRYGNPQQQAGLQPHQVAPVSPTVEYPFELDLRLHGPLARARLSSPSHALAVEPSGDGRSVAVTLAQPGWLDRDLVLVLERLPGLSLGLRAAPDAALRAGRIPVLLAMPVVPPETLAPVSRPMRLKMLIDCSGSMSGASLQSAQQALRHGIASLRSGDQFSLSRFGTEVQHRSRALWTTTPASLQAAQEWVDHLAADLGGTEMSRALASVLALPADGPCDVLLVTDGQIHGVTELIETARAGRQRIFVVGIGPAVPEAMLRELALQTGGASEFVTHGEAVGGAMQRLFARLREPGCTGLRLRLPPDAGEPIWASAPPDIGFPGETLVLRLWLERLPAEGDFVLEGLPSDGLGQADEPVELARLPVSALDEAGERLPRMLVAAELAQVVHAQAPGSALPPALLERVLAARLMSSGTRFLMVDERQDVPPVLTMPRQQVVPQMATPDRARFSPGQRVMRRASVSTNMPRAPMTEADREAQAARQAAAEREGDAIRDMMIRKRFRRAEVSRRAGSPEDFLQTVLIARAWQTPLDWTDLQRMGLSATVVQALKACGQPEGSAELLAALIELLCDWDVDQQAPGRPGSGGIWHEALVAVLREALRPERWDAA